jgi:hypothetical protein
MSPIQFGLILLVLLSLAGCSDHAAGQVANTDTDHGSIAATLPCIIPGAEKFRVQVKDTLFPGRYAGSESRIGDLVKLTPEEREHFLRSSAKDHADAELYFFSIIRCEPQMKEVTLLSSHFNGTDILWLAYDGTGTHTGLDTLLSSFADGQQFVEEYAYMDDFGRMLIGHVALETAWDGNDTIAYTVDTLIYEKRLEGYGVIREGSTEAVTEYVIDREPVDLSKHWFVKFPVADPARKQTHSIRPLLRGRRPIQVAWGDMDGNGMNDIVMVFDPASDAADDARDLLSEHTFLPDIIPGASAGGFHDAIDEACCSGISIIRDTLVIGLFGGRAWKWQTRDHYLYDADQDAFFLVKKQTREYHASTLANAEGELFELEQVVAKGGTLDPDQYRERTRLIQVLSDADWKTTLYPIGERRLGEVD